jgi:hypothetical protein
MRVVGRELATRLTRPFVHLRLVTPPGSLDLRLDVWDGRETNVAHPADSSWADLQAVEADSAEPAHARVGRDGDAQRWRVDGGLATSFIEGRVFRFVRPGAVTWLDRGAGRIIGWRASGEELAMQEQSKPLPLLLGIWYVDHDIHVIHAGLVARDGAGVLVGGGSGSGKTTTTLACLRSGFDFLGDDQCGLEAREDGTFVGHSVYGGARVEPHHAQHFPHLRATTTAGHSRHDDKLLLFPGELLAARPVRSAPIRAIVLPRVVAATSSRVRPASAGKAMLRLAPTSLFTPFGTGARGFERLTRLVESVPAYWLDLGRDIAAIPDRLHDVLEEMGVRR